MYDDNVDHAVTTTVSATVTQGALDPRLIARAERTLSEYLRGWGLRDPSTIAHHCRRLTQQALSAGSRAPDEVSNAAMAAAMSEINRWLDHVAEQMQTGGQAAANRGLIALEVQALLFEYPEAFLRYGPLPSSVAIRIRRSVQAVAPPVRRTYMAQQPLGELHAVLQPNKWWRRWLARRGKPAAALETVNK